MFFKAKEEPKKPLPQVETWVKERNEVELSLEDKQHDKPYCAFSRYSKNPVVKQWFNNYMDASMWCLDQHNH